MKDTSSHPVEVSVIMPVYNTEEFVGEALNSVRLQTLREIEIIVINDGSTDGSLRVLEQLAAEDSRIRLYSQPNAGQSVARNNALKFATGDYIYFMDSDDIIEPDTFQVCVQKCEAQNLDFVFFDADILNKESKLAVPLLYNRSNCMDETEMYPGTLAMQKQLHARSYTPSPCLSLIRTAYLRKLKLRFHPGIIHEDQLFNALLYVQAGRVAYINRRFFKRRFREASTMTQRFSWRNIKGYLTVTEELLRFKKQSASDEQKQIIDALLRQMLDDVVWSSYVLPLRQRVNLLLLCFQRQYSRYVSSRTFASMLAKSFIR